MNSAPENSPVLYVKRYLAQKGSAGLNRGVTGACQFFQEFFHRQRYRVHEIMECSRSIELIAEYDRFLEEYIKLYQGPDISHVDQLQLFFGII